jgi:alkanesulfonate monooxygenase SsuD/methylene tetrahydromethanopterin reductase-like flavin-dependent oxidoreductase (luciferase family)
MRFCLETWGTNYSKIKETCILAEKLGYYGFYYGEALSPIHLDCWTVISSLIPLTNKIKLGPVITYLYPQYRSIALLAKQATTFQEISNGRLEFRTGAGATPQYALQWWHPYGIDYPKEFVRVSILKEGIEVLKALWNQHQEDNDTSPSTYSSIRYNGKFFRINGVSPFKSDTGATFTKTKIPITISAKKRRMLHLAAKFADIWEASYLSPQEFKVLNFQFERINQELDNEVNNTNFRNDRNRTGPSKSIEIDVIIAESDTELEYKKKLFSMERGPGSYSQILKHGLIGTPEKVATRVKEYTDIGINQFLLAFRDPFDLGSIELFADAVKGI